MNIPIYARHETFHPRFGWLKKGFDKANEDNSVFLKKDAPIILGVGKNMVKAIRYWCIAFKVLDDSLYSSSKKTSGISPSETGNSLLNNNGWDPFLEDIASLWLLHWRLLSPPCYATAWFYVFNMFQGLEFSQDDLLFGLKDYNQRTHPDVTIAESSLVKDINCLLHMYSHNSSDNALVENSIDSPFKEMGLILPVGNSKRYTFNIGDKHYLPAEIVVSTCLEFASLNENNAKTIALSRLLYDIGSPGLVFKLTENALYEAIEKVSAKFSQITLSDTAGLIQFSYNQDPKDLSAKILRNYYQVHSELVEQTS